MSIRKWATADWHLGEDRFEIMARPFKTKGEQVQRLIKLHNELVAPTDLVYVLGDVCYKEAPDYLSYVKDFNGQKILVRGNHDEGIKDAEFKKYFDEVIAHGDGIELEIEGIDCYLTHYPTRGRPDRFNLVGHIHSAWKYQLNMFNVGVDTNHFRPVDLATIPQHLGGISKYYDEDVWVAYNDLNKKYRGERGKPGSYFKD